MDYKPTVCLTISQGENVYLDDGLAANHAFSAIEGDRNTVTLRIRSASAWMGNLPGGL